MTRPTVLVAFLAGSAAIPWSQVSARPSLHSSAQTGVSRPTQATVPRHYCNLGFFTAEGLARHKALSDKFATAVTAVEEIDNGFVVRFSGEFREAGEWLDGVRGCCPTIEYSMTVAPQSGPAAIKITGGPGAKDFIREEFSKILGKQR